MQPGEATLQCIIRFHWRVWIGCNIALQAKLVSVLRNNVVGSHFGLVATYHCVKLFLCTRLKQAVDDFVLQCEVCQHAKYEQTKPANMELLLVPEGPWTGLTMDFVEGLP